MMDFIEIDGREVGTGRPSYVIAEAGVNHNGSVAMALRLIEAAALAGADAIKFQTFTTRNLVTKSAACAEYQTQNAGQDTQLAMLRSLELALQDFQELKARADQLGITFLTTAHTPDVLEGVDRLVPAHKVGSGDLTNVPLLKEIARFNKPIFLSTGMSTFDEVAESVEAIRGQGNDKIVLLHCTSEYPCPLEDVNLSAMEALRRLECPVGYSDHTEGIEIPLMAARLGATVIEKHFTLDRNLPGPDHRTSLEPPELKEMMSQLRSGAYAQTPLMPEVLGSAAKIPTSRELQMARLVRKSVVAARDIVAGETFTLENLALKRPGTGLPPKELDKLIGARARRTLLEDDLVELADVELQPVGSIP